MIQVIQFPIRNLNDNTALPSRWSAVHHPILFKLCRKDVNVVQVQYLNGLFRAILQTVPADLAVGQTCRLVSGQTNADIVVTGISGNQITMTGNIAPYSTGGYLNLVSARKNYIVDVRVLAVDNTNTYYPVGNIEVKPGPDGTFPINPAGYVKAIAEMTDSFLYNQINKRIVGAGSRFNFQFRESWIGYDGEYSTLSNSNVFYWTNATKQLQQRYNFNVAEHVIFPNINTTKFMSDFEVPTYFPGFPFSLSFIWSDRVTSNQLQRVEEQFTQANVSTGTATTTLDGSQNLAVNRMLISGTYPSTTNRIEVWLNDNGVQPIRYVNPGYVLSGYTGVLTGLPTIKPVRNAQSN